MSKLVVAKDLWKTYHLSKKVSVDALRGLDLTINEHEFVSIIGPSGSGKSTLLNLIGCLDIPTKGKLTLDRKKIASMSDKMLTQVRAEKIGYIFQTFNLLPSLRALENVEFPMRIIAPKKRLDKNARRERAKELLKIIGLERRVNHLPAELSGGERQRVAIARALANDPKIILADEPTGNLDSVTSRKIIELLHEINKEGKTIIMVTHDMETTEGTRVYKMKDGKIES
jgi:putative ABC transport system ATP-binding protein